jgi:hypothetical protein
MLKRIALTILLAIQVLGGGAVTLAHARDLVVAQPGVEPSHTARCAILHDEVRCALGHYASARVIVQQVFTGSDCRLAVHACTADCIDPPNDRLTSLARALPFLS